MGHGLLDYRAFGPLRKKPRTANDCLRLPHPFVLSESGDSKHCRHHAHTQRGVSLVLISVHLPKAAGTSFGAALEAYFGESLLRDYGDMPINTPPYDRNKAALQRSIENAEAELPGVKCIHGHFLPVKYLLLSRRQNTDFVTWLRHPVERAVSHFYFWQRSFDPTTSPPLHRRVMEERWSLERFCLGPELRNLYSQFLFGFPLEYFAFIGISEFYNHDFEFFTRAYLGASIEPSKLNVGNAAGRNYEISDTLRSDISRFHSEDMNLYQRALAIRDQRCSA